jgi:hypothetical protein
MKRTFIMITAVAALAGLVACTERPQTLDSGVKVDAQAFQGTGMAYEVPGWKQGDKVSWEQHMKVRTQNQNDYSRVN